jgi:IMP dehydrogenase
MLDKEPRQGWTYDDVVLVPAKSQVLPSEVDTGTFVSRNIRINIPMVSAAMDTVTEARLAIAMAREGGIGIVHRVLSPADQATEVDKVKKSESGMILDPVTISPDQTIRDAHNLMAKYRISGIPVTKGSQARRHSYQPRSSLRDQDGPQSLSSDEAGQANHGP